MLETLPTEVLLLVLQNFTVQKDKTRALLDDDDPTDNTVHDQKDLARLCRVSKSFKALAQPLLYQVYVKMEVTPSDDDGGFSEGYSNENLRLFLRTMISRPELAAHVAMIKIEPWETEDSRYRSNILLRQPCNNLQKLYLEAASKLNIGTRHYTWIGSLLLGDENAEIALLLALLPNIKDIEIGYPSGYEDLPGDFFLKDVFAKARENAFLNTGLAFHKLRSVFIYGPTYTYPNGQAIHFEFFPLMDVFLLPGLETFNMFAIQYAYLEATMQSLLDQESTIKSLSFGDTDLAPDQIEVVLNNCPKLENLTLHFCECMEESNGVFTWPAYVKALEPRKDTLVRLQLTSDEDSLLHDPVVATDEGAPWSYISTLQDFTKLRKLVVEQATLLGVPVLSANSFENPVPLAELLPRSLETLTWADDCTLFGLEKLDELSSVVKRSLPNLRFIDIGEIDLSGRCWVEEDDDVHEPEMRNGEKPEVVLKRAMKNFEAAGVVWRQQQYNGSYECTHTSEQWLEPGAYPEFEFGSDSPVYMDNLVATQSMDFTDA